MVDTPLCSGCHTEGKLRCGKCHAVGFEVRYCGAKHQKALWPTHKWFCGKKDQAFFHPALATEETACFAQNYQGEQEPANKFLQLLGTDSALHVRMMNVMNVTNSFDAGRSLQPFTTTTYWVFASHLEREAPTSSSNFYKAALNLSTMADNAALRGGNPLEKEQVKSLLGRMEMEARKVDAEMGGNEALRTFRGQLAEEGMLAKLPEVLKMWIK